MIRSAGLVPAVHDFMRASGGGEDVDARTKPAQGVFQVADVGAKPEPDSRGLSPGKAKGKVFQPQRITH